MYSFFPILILMFWVTIWDEQQQNVQLPVNLNLESPPSPPAGTLAPKLIVVVM